MKQNISITLNTYKYIIITLGVTAFLLQMGNFVDEDSAWWISSIVYVIVPGALVFFSVLLTIKIAKIGQSIMLILLFTISVSMYFVAEQVWFVYELLDEEPFPSWADVFYIGHYPPLIIFLFKIIKVPIRNIPKKNLLYIGLLTSSFFIPTLLSSYDLVENADLFETSLTLFYPILDIIVIFPLFLSLLYSINGNRNFLIFMTLGAFATLLADTFYVFLYQKEMYLVGHPSDILWVWGYLFFTFAILSKNNSLNFKKEEDEKINLRMNNITPMLCGSVLLVLITSFVIILFLISEDIREYDLENLFFFGILIIFVGGISITLFTLKVKKIRSQVIIGMSLVCMIFVVQAGYQHTIDNEVIEISEYHDLMSIPAISTLDKIEINFERMHSSLHGFVLNHEDSLIKYDENFSMAQKSIERYNILTYQKGPDDTYLANSVMRNNMQNYVNSMNSELNNYDLNKKYLVSSGVENNFQMDKLFILLDDNANTFRNSLNDAREMEISGAKTIHMQIENIKPVATFAQTMSLFFVLIIIAIIIIVINNILKNNIQILKETTTRVAKGEFSVQVEMPDKTEFKEIGDQINLMASELAEFQKESLKTEKLKSIGELSSRLGHDLRNPLSAMKLSVRIIKMKAEKEKIHSIQKNLNVLDQSIERMSHQIEDVLDYIRTKPLKISENSLQSILKDAIESITIPENIKISQTSNDVKINCEPHKILVVFINIIQNAIHAIGESHGEISIQIKECDDNIICSIIDSGLGIHKDNLNHVFDPLFTTKQIGTGLGLSSCKSIIQQHNGTIEVSNNPTTFKITLPKKQVKSLRITNMILSQ